MNFIKTAFLFTFFFISLSSFSQENSEYKTKKAVQDIGDYLRYGMPIAAGLTTILIKDKKGTWQFAKGFTVNLAVTYALKYAINKPRPAGATDGHAFPSGHTSVAFQSASFIQKRYGWKYGIPSYALAGFVAYSRIEGYKQRHDGWDVLGGIIVGVGSTYLFTTPYQKEHLKLAYTSYDSTYLIGLKYTF
ncbi:phosphatase PAP2 family protein [Lacinutrix sp. MEBiC02404]